MFVCQRTFGYVFNKTLIQHHTFVDFAKIHTEVMRNINSIQIKKMKIENAEIKSRAISMNPIHRSIKIKE